MQNQEHVSLNLNIRGLKKSATIAINDLSKQLISEGRTVYKLGLGQSPFPIPNVVAESLRQNAHQKDYLPVQGLRELREAVAGFHSRNDGITCNPDNVLIGPGSKELMFLLQLTYYGDLVVPTPCWVSYSPQAQIIGRRVVYLPTDFEHEWHLQPWLLSKICKEDPGRPRIVILNYPGNPDGGTYQEDTLRELAEIAKKYDVIILSDEIYGKLCHNGKHISISRFYPEGTIISSGLSKWCGAGGWRLGTFMFPDSFQWLREAMASVASETFTSTSSPIQYAAIRAFQGGVVLERYLVHVRRILRALGNWCAEKLESAGARIQKPTGAFYLFPDFSPLKEKLAEKNITTSTELCHRALEETGVAFLPGKDFGRPNSELTARIAYVDFDGARALTASEQIPLDQEINFSFINAYCYQTVKAIEVLCDWIGELTS